ncbi:ester cyclase [Deinococcus yavapaiensis]|uniref:Putative ester cyclase n=1 Tax=Deinococcus yavapaiensis KR-236 TaxID=694435 RepID=A0A318S9A2_9DEIO|nr:ester cyclase [Deinococcus yavapaiensis]PYE54798.1 putative ester cyclase [Deinococcus yavapaiensis KR-236]
MEIDTVSSVISSNAPGVLRGVLRRLLEDAWGRADVSAIRDGMVPNLVNHNPMPGTTSDRDGYEQAVRMFHEGLTITSMVMRHQLVDGDLAVDHWEGEGVHTGNFAGIPATGKTLKLRGLGIGRFENGLIVERWGQMNMMDVLQQLDVIPGGGEAQPPLDLPIVEGRVTTPEENKAAVRRLTEEVWNQGRTDVIPEIYHDLSVAPDVPQLPVGPAGTRFAVETFRTAFPDFHMTIEHLLAEGDFVVARFRQQGTHRGDLFGIPPTGHEVDFEEIALLQFADGKVIGTWYETDMMTLMSQLGVGPAREETVTQTQESNENTSASTRDVIDAYYRLANAGDWSAWCDLFTDDLVMDEQLAGHIETLATLRPMMDGMGTAYSRFQNVPRHIIVSENEAAVVSHISALAAKYPDRPIEAEVMNYFRLRDGKIAYMANFHDSVPFKPFLDQLSGGEA